jgi:hypothetical protein
MDSIVAIKRRYGGNHPKIAELTLRAEKRAKRIDERKVQAKELKERVGFLRLRTGDSLTWMFCSGKRSISF